ncbi:hypothetical protein IF2G_05231 [Cordyceps javanica]|nr:hypothetical protein IF2G_05231 [Cordyceps javanica]
MTGPVTAPWTRGRGNGLQSLPIRLSHEISPSAHGQACSSYLPFPPGLLIHILNGRSEPVIQEGWWSSSIC